MLSLDAGEGLGWSSWSFGRYRAHPLVSSTIHSFFNLLFPLLLRLIVRDVALEHGYFLLSTQPLSHLRELVPEVGCSPCILSVVYVKSFKHFSIIIICSSKIAYTLLIVQHGVKLWYVEVISYTKVHQDVLVCMKIVQGIGEILESRVVVSGILGNVNKVE